MFIFILHMNAIAQYNDPKFQISRKSPLIHAYHFYFVSMIMLFAILLN